MATRAEGSVETRAGERDTTTSAEQSHHTLTGSREGVDLAVAVVTGATVSGGIGYETAKLLAANGVHTVLAGSKMSKTEFEDFKEEVKKSKPTGESGTGDDMELVESIELDLSSFDSIKKFVVEFKKRHDTHLNYLLHCAGVIFVKLDKTTNDFERHFQVNHLGPFLLTLELHQLLKMGAERRVGARVVMVTSSAHSSADFDPSNINAERYYSRFLAYYNSKLYNVMFAYCLQRRFTVDKISVACVHPGKIRSKFTSEVCTNRPILKAISAVILRVCYSEVGVGAERVMACLKSKPNQWFDMQYFHKNTHDQERVSKSARDVRSQKKLWEISVAAVKGHLSEMEVNRFVGTETEERLLLETVRLREEVKKKGGAQPTDDEMEEMAAIKLKLKDNRKGYGEGQGEEPGADLLQEMVDIKKSGYGKTVEDLLERAKQLREWREGRGEGEGASTMYGRETSV